jgi:hypothetical protein
MPRYELWSAERASEALDRLQAEAGQKGKSRLGEQSSFQGT